MRKLDRIDHQILEILQKDGRIAISELASRVNLSTTPCSERVKRLERDGIIMGYYARLNPQLVDRNLLVFLEIKLSAKSGDVFDIGYEMPNGDSVCATHECCYEYCKIEGKKITQESED